MLFFAVTYCTMHFISHNLPSGCKSPLRFLVKRSASFCLNFSFATNGISLYSSLPDEIFMVTTVLLILGIIFGYLILQSAHSLFESLYVVNNFF